MSSQKTLSPQMQPRQCCRADQAVARTLQAWSEIVGIDAEVIRSRINRRNWTTEQALTTPVGQRRCIARQGSHISHAEAAAYAYGELASGRSHEMEERWKYCGECFRRMQVMADRRTACAAGEHVGAEAAASFGRGTMSPERMRVLLERTRRCETCDQLLDIAVAHVRDQAREEHAQAVGRSS